MNANAATQTSDQRQRFQPRDRETFFAAQARNRRATWRMSGLCVASAALMGFPLALIVTPFLYALALIVADVVNLFAPLPPEVWQQADHFARVGLLAFGWLLQKNAADPQQLAVGAAVLLAPGMCLSFVLWLGVESLFRRSGTGGALLALQAREPNHAELKELQLADVVQEMAIAAGLPAPKIMLIDSSGANAAVIGASPDDARIVVTRGLLDVLSRDELEAIFAHLIASVGNGDLRVAVHMTSIFEVCGLLLAIVNAPFGSQSRRLLWRTMRYGFAGKAGSPEEASAVAELLTKSANPDDDDIDRFFDTTPKKSFLRSLRGFLFFPIFFTNTALKLLLWFFSWAVLGPSLALLWRTRQYLADASAVQLTRNPGSLARALKKLNDEPGAIPGGDWASHLFLASPRGNAESNSETLSSRQREILAHAWTSSSKEPLTVAVPATLPEISNEFTKTLRAAMAGDVDAVARVRSVYQSVAAADPALAAQFPNPDDFFSARQGDLMAIARLRAAQRSSDAQNGMQSSAARPQEQDSIGSFLDFHPPLKRRLKRLIRMGVDVQLAEEGSKAGMFVLFLSLFLGPFALCAVVLLLLLIAVMILASFTFMAMWLAVLHKLFLLFAHPGA